VNAAASASFQRIENHFYRIITINSDTFDSHYKLQAQLRSPPTLSFSPWTDTVINGGVHDADCNGVIKQDNEASSALDFFLSGEIFLFLSFFITFFPFFLLDVSISRIF